MALIQCDECGNQVSDRAKSCPKCGAPVGGEMVTLTEQTSKKWKAIQVFGAVIILCSFMGCLVAVGSEKPDAVAMPGLGVLLGFAVHSVGRFGAWWYHK